MNDLTPATPANLAQTQEPIHALLAQRWSPRAFASDKPVSQAQLLALAEAARWAPSCFGDQPWHYIICARASERAAWEAVLGTLTGANPSWAQHAPVLIAAVAATRFKHDGSENRWAQHDTGAASMSMALQAVALGLVAHQMGGFDSARLRTALAIPDDYMPMAVIAVGYAAPAQILPPPLAARETAPRARLPLAQNFFAGRWAQPLV